MRNKTMTLFGIVIIVWGAIVLVNNLTDINLWVYIWPLLLIALGVWIIAQPARFPMRSVRFLRDLDRRGEWTVQPEDMTCFVADIDLDMSEADIPSGDTSLRMRGFVGDITLRVPTDVGLRIEAQAVVVDANVFGYNQDYFLTPYEYQSENYTTAERTITLACSYFVTSLKVRRG